MHPLRVRRAGTVVLAALLLMVALGPAGRVWAQTASPITLSLSAAPTDLSADALTQDLRAASLLFAAEREGRLDAQDVFAAAQADYARLLSALYARSHYGGTISIRLDGREAALIGPFDAPDQIAQVDITIDPGPAFRFGRARITPLAPETKLPADFATGQPAPSPIIAQAAQTALAAWRGAGHARARITDQTVRANHATATLDAQITIDPDQRARFGRLGFVGDTGVRPDRLAKIAGFPTGRYFSPQELEDVIDRLRRTGVFRAISPQEADTINPDGTLDVEITLADQPLRRLGFGGEISNGEGLDLGAYLINRNLLGGAERLRLDVGINQIAAPGTEAADYSLGLAIDRPATITPDTTLGVGIELRHEDDGTTRSDLADIEGSLSHIVSHNTTLRGGVKWSYETSTRSGVPDSQQTTFRTLSAPLGITWDRRDNRLDPRWGHLADAEVSFFRSYRGTADDGARLMLDLRAYRPLGDRLVLAGRMQTGAVLGARWRLTPREYLFKSGGAGTVRGQPYEALTEPLCSSLLLGGTEPCGVGGTHFLGASVEARATLRGAIGGVAFVDYGRIGVGGLDDSSVLWHAGAGLGLRYDTGFGPIRLDLAHPVGNGDTDGGMQLYLGIGQAF